MSIDAPRDKIVQLLAARAARYAVAKETAALGGYDIVSFRRGARRYGVRLDSLSSIRRLKHLAPIPGISKVIVGVTNVQGRLVAVHDVLALEDEELTIGDGCHLLVGSGDARSVALLADEIESIERLHDDEIRPTPLGLREHADWCRGLRADELVVLDFEQLVDSDAFFQASSG